MLDKILNKLNEYYVDENYNRDLAKELYRIIQDDSMTLEQLEQQKVFYKERKEESGEAKDYVGANANQIREEAMRHLMACINQKGGNKKRAFKKRLKNSK